VWALVYEIGQRDLPAESEIAKVEATYPVDVRW